MQKLEGFQYATALDIKMQYYTIRLSPASQDMKTVVTEFPYLINQKEHQTLPRAHTFWDKPNLDLL